MEIMLSLRAGKSNDNFTLQYKYTKSSETVVWLVLVGGWIGWGAE